MDSTPTPSDGPMLHSESPGEASEPIVAPPVVAVVVTRDPGPWLEEGLEAIGASDYPGLTVLVLDAGSTVDPTARVAGVLPGAFVRRLPEAGGFAAAANDVIDVVQGATFILFCHDDVVVDPSAIRLLVEEAFRSNAAIIGPKLVQYDHPEVLLEVGMAIDRFGVPHSGIEPGELDQEQHDSVRDVFFVSSTVMLVRSDLFAELGGFDDLTFPGAEDLDLCWRARIAGARVMVAPDARARHREADKVHDSSEAVSPAVAQRSRLRAMLKSASGWSLAYLLPIALVLAVVEVVAFALTRRRDRAKALIGAWVWNARNFGNLRRARHSAQALRRVPDVDLRSLQVRGSARVRGYVAGSLQAEDRIRSISERSRNLSGSATGRLRDPASIAALVFAVLVLIGSRGLLFGRVPVIGQLPGWPGVGGLVETFTSAWRYSDLGSATPAPSQLGIFSVLGTLALGATGFARTVVVVGALPFGVFGAWRLSRRITGPGSAAVVAALAYGINPLPRNALADGRFGSLVLYAFAPMILSSMLRVGGYLPEEAPRRWWRAVVALGAIVAVTTAAWPPAVLVPLMVALALTLAQPIARGPGRLGSLWKATLVSTGVGVVLLLPWPLAFLRSGDRLAALGFAFKLDFSFSEVLRFQTGPNGAGLSGWIIAGTALLVLVLASGPRLVWATRAWVLALLSFACVWLPSRFFTDVPMPAVEGLLVLAALGVSLAVGLGVAAFIADVRSFHFGWRQVAAVGGAIALAFPVFAFAVDALDGRWHMPPTDWNQNLSWMRSEDESGQFRVLWLGNPAVLPVDPVVRGDVGYGVTNDGPGDARTALPPPAGGTSGRIGHAVDLLRERRSNRIGALLGPMGVRYLAVPERPDPGLERTDPAPPRLLVALDDQLDLIRLEGPPGLELYENRAWIPGAASMPARLVPRGGADQVGPPVGSPPPRPVRNGVPVRAGAILWSQTYDGAWSASSNGASLPHRQVFGWANGYTLDRPGTVSFSYGNQWQRYPALLVELGLVGGAFVLWRGSARFKWPFRRRPLQEVES
ncbi:MAG: glycosyltransferase [Acidimicrobiia bacterium]